MVVRPKEIADKIEENDGAAFREFEAQIDEILQNRYVPGHDVGVPFPNGVKNHQKFLTRVIRMYEEAGWEVKFVSDQRDGDYLNFQANNPGGQR